MTQLLRAAEMRALEQKAIKSGAVSGLDLMERAGAGVVGRALDRWSEPMAAGSAAVLCGPGNNGGDGYVVARLLRQHGWSVDVRFLGDPEKLPPDAAVNYRRWREIGNVRAIVDDLEDTAQAVAVACLVVDALFGTGLGRRIDLPLDHLMRGAGRVVAVDVPSGLCADSGRIIGAPEGQAVTADLTVTFHTAKPGHYLADGPARCGALEICDIGLPVA
ncbi:NAD(P)H-hydrate epimerase [Sulfitobacter sp. LCG007]